jgi:dihydrofolate reductase
VIAIVVARSANGVIGRDGGLPWHLPTDLRRFKELTSGGTVLMGRKTYESLPDRFRPLPGRRNVVVSRRGCDGAPEVHAGLDAALEACGGDCFVIGGGQVYAQALPVADRVYATEVHAEVAGDVVFPPLPEEEWRCVERSETIEENGHAFSFRTYARA